VRGLGSRIHIVCNMMQSGMKVPGWAAMLFALPALCCFGMVGCSSSAGPTDAQRVAACLRQYHEIAPDTMPVGSDAQGVEAFPTVTDAVPCQGLKYVRSDPWLALVVAADDRTVRVYFTGSPVDVGCGLLAKVTVTERSDSVAVQVFTGWNPDIVGDACPQVGHYYVTQVALSRPLAGRKFTGPNHDGVVVHL
jgi:hypothetical protein